MSDMLSARSAQAAVSAQADNYDQAENYDPDTVSAQADNYDQAENYDPNDIHDSDDDSDDSDDDSDDNSTPAKYTIDDLEGFCYLGKKDKALAVIQQCIEDGFIDEDIFADAVYNAAAEDHDPKVRETLIAVCDAANDLLKNMEFNTGAWNRGTDWCWNSISAEVKHYWSRKV